jgi:hypothetical protein
MQSKFTTAYLVNFNSELKINNLTQYNIYIGVFFCNLIALNCKERYFEVVYIYTVDGAYILSKRK